MLTALVALILASTASAGEVMFTQQGRLLDDVGAPLEGTHRLDVSLHTAVEDGTEVWHGTFNTVNFEQGHYLVTLTGPGTLGTDLDDVMAGGAALFFELEVNQDPLTPRQPLSYVPAAAHAARAAGVSIVDVDTGGGLCDAVGGLGYDESRETLYLCNGSVWFPAYTADRPPVAFTYAGQDQTWTVPPGVTEVTVTAWGAGGGAGRVASVRGGAGGYTRATVPVTPGDVLTVVVGQGGTHIEDGMTGAGKGGGLSGVFSGAPSQATAMVVAGGGGGGGYYESALGGSYGGNGGGVNGTDGSATDASYYASRGRGATEGGGGAGGCYTSLCGTAGTALQGGDGAGSPYPGTYGGGGGNGRSGHNSGGGGGGYWGGGGGANGAPLGGGGGSGYVMDSGTNRVLLTGASPGVPPQSGHELYLPGVAVGGVDNGVTGGGPGLVVIEP